MATGEKERRNRAAVRRIRFLLENNRLPVHRAAELMGVRKSVLQDVLDRKNQPTEELLRKIAAYFDVELEFICGAEESVSSPGASASASKGPTSTPKKASPEARTLGKATPAGSSSARSKGSPKKSSRGTKLNTRSLASRHQALLELLLEKRVITAAEYHARIEEVENRRG